MQRLHSQKSIMESDLQRGYEIMNAEKTPDFVKRTVSHLETQLSQVETLAQSKHTTLEVC